RDRNEHVEGLTEPHDVDLMLDGERLRLFTVKPPPAGVDHHLVDNELNIRVPVKAGPHVLAAAFPKKTSALLETERQPYQAHFNMDRHPRLQPAVYSITVNGPYEAKGPGDTPSRRRIFVCRPAQANEEEGCARKILAAVLEQQVRRMLADARSQSLVGNFAEQWLYLRNLASTTPDMRLFPDFDDNLRQAFRQETELFFDSIMREDRNVLDLLRANYTFVNERLAKHYGIPNVYGSRFRRVTFDDGSVRGG